MLVCRSSGRPAASLPLPLDFSPPQAECMVQKSGFLHASGSPQSQQPLLPGRDAYPHHVSGVVGGVEASAAEAAGVVGAARLADVASLARLENVAASLASRSLGVLASVDGPLGFLQAGRDVAERQGLLGEEQAHVLVLAGQAPEQVVEQVFRRCLGVPVFVLGRQLHQELAELPLLRRHGHLHIVAAVLSTHHSRFAMSGSTEKWPGRCRGGEGGKDRMTTAGERQAERPRRVGGGGFGGVSVARRGSAREAAKTKSDGGIYRYAQDALQLERKRTSSKSSMEGARSSNS